MRERFTLLSLNNRRVARKIALNPGGMRKSSHIHLRET